jgi:hypothetical protein
MLKYSRTPLSEKWQKKCGQKQKNMRSKLKKNTAKKTIDRSVIEPIIIDFCDDSDDDMGWSIIILSIIVWEKNVKIE